MSGPIRAGASVNSVADVTTGDIRFYTSGQDLTLNIDGTGAAAALRLATDQIGGISAVRDFDIHR